MESVKKYKVFLGSPCYKWPADPHYAASVQETIAHPNLDVEFRTVIGDADINRARACVLKHFLELDAEKKFDYFLNIDWDIEFRAFDVHRACQRMEELGYDIIGGPYPYKSDAEGKKECIVFRCDPKAMPDSNYMLPCEYVGGGYMMVKASFLREMCKHYEELRFNLNPDLDPKRSATYLLWRNDLLERPDWGEGERELLSEDYSFCHKAKLMGAKIGMDLTIALKHWDGDKAYTLPMKPESEVTKNDLGGVRDVEGKPSNGGCNQVPETPTPTGE